MESIQTQLQILLDRTKNIKPPISAAPLGMNINEYNKPSEVWVNDVEIFYQKYLKKHPLSNQIERLLFHRNINTYSKLITFLESIRNDSDFWEETGNIISSQNKKNSDMTLKYDVFISHANADKENLIEELYQSLKKLDIKIFYDKESLEWGDKFKDKILDGTKKAEFAIIVISENFFDREWTEIELNEFLNRQNRNGQKIILPIIHNITIQQLKEKYPTVADIQAIDSKTYSCDQIALLFARQLIKRLKAYQ